MGEKTGIAWTDHTFNPWIGCQKIRKITYLDLSERTGLHRNTISYIFSGERINSARLNDLAKIAHAMDCDLRIELIPLKNVTYQKSGA